MRNTTMVKEGGFCKKRKKEKKVSLSISVPMPTKWKEPWECKKHVAYVGLCVFVCARNLCHTMHGIPEMPETITDIKKHPRTQQKHPKGFLQRVV